MEATRELMHEAIDKYGLGSLEALKASHELDKHIEIAQRQRVLTKAEFMTKVVNDLIRRNKQLRMKLTYMYGIRGAT